MPGSAGNRFDDPDGGLGKGRVTETMAESPETESVAPAGDGLSCSIVGFARANAPATYECTTATGSTRQG